jgi:putative ABC transport system permease protein
MIRFQPHEPDDVRASVERDIDDELTFHRERTVEELKARGLSEADAEKEADRRFGPPRHRRALVHLELRRQSGQRRRTSMEILRTSVRAVVRGIRRSPGFTLGVVMILTLGLGVNAITFGLVDRLILSGPAAIQQPDQLRRVVVHRHDRRGAELTTTELGYLDYRDFLSVRQLAGVAGESESPLLFGSGETAERIQGRLVTASYFPLLGVTPAIGRFFSADESEKQAARVVVLSHAFWQRRFGGDPGVIGQVLPIESHRYTVVGVAPQYFTGTAVTRVDVFLPLEAASDEQVEGPWRSIRNFRWMGSIVRLGPGVGDGAAAAEITAAYRQGYAKEPDADPQAWIELTSLNPVRGATAAGDLGVAALVGGVALFVMLIAFANVANLFLARSLRRRDFLAVRIALGGSRARLVAEQATEGALLALLGAAAAVLVAAAGTRPAQLLLFPEVHWLETTVNLRELIFVAACAVVGGGLAAALPMWQAGRANIVSWLRVGGQRVSRTRTQGAMLILQGALSVLLLVGAGLFVRSLIGIRSTSLGIDAGRLLVVSTLRGDAPPRADFRTSFRAIVDKIPGVERTTIAAGTLPFVSSWGVRLTVPGLAERPTVPDGGPYINSVEPGYFETVGTRIVDGRPFTADDRAGAPRVAIVNQSMARLYWPGESAIGKCLQIGPDTPPCSTVVGVAENTRRNGILEGESLLYYVPNQQGPPDLRGGRLVVRTADADSGTKARVAETIRREALLLEPGLRYVTARSLDDVIAPQLRTWELGAGLFGVFGLLALAVSAVGLYSVIAFDVEGRRREIGVRSALGAPSSAILRLIVGDGLRLSLGGLAAGLLLAWLLAPLASELLYQVAPQDAVVFAGASAALIAAAIIASVIPAFRAARIDPTEALKEQ